MQQSHLLRLLLKHAQLSSQASQKQGPPSRLSPHCLPGLETGLWQEAGPHNQELSLYPRLLPRCQAFQGAGRRLTCQSSSSLEAGCGNLERTAGLPPLTAAISHCGRGTRPYTQSPGTSQLARTPSFSLPSGWKPPGCGAGAEPCWKIPEAAAAWPTQVQEGDPEQGWQERSLQHRKPQTLSHKLVKTNA